ncbi:hypothetical protein [Dolichospermum circinale]|uniref:hypothetical protein n=1 Tax=Dolichospermum circinale TaxID=109265 RepID=UPI00232F3EB7|nr:hypothetical protein [Dolichospermum circinale]MDB9454463.1 hypothetical protein [Dolichospermum circinale CS-541/06]MDB9464471.1 hypothetical protein [Dolichospermum circinale CS-541/04]MDB9546929.1 hypothetical protein [Dolichospermum circinale CS-1031]
MLRYHSQLGYRFEVKLTPNAVASAAYQLPCAMACRTASLSCFIVNFLNMI